ncbi:MAG: hypothetical protein A2505_09015 [Deltaproteobacteria bacterium RIFOXYD12_FULL_55_16]|nr:MAG: hypothetical protein A2505_09015 [Deltaproteobacteria bacterium RIFOXYD12_FULL_55_16]
MSLADRFFARFKNSEPLALELISRRCLRTRFQGSSCDRCLSECPAGAIRLESGQIVLDQKLCLGCLTCTAVCPAGALIGLDSRLAAAPGKVAAGKAVSLCCEKGIRSGEEVILPCLGALAGEQLAAVAARSGQDIFLRLSCCADCRSAFVPDILARRLLELKGRLENEALCSGIQLLITKEQEATADQAEAASSRRAFFRAFWDISLHAATETISTIKADPNPQEKHAHKHQPARLSQLRQALSDSGDQGHRLALLKLFFTLTVNSECNFCGGCAGMCPTGALKNTREDEVKRLKFDWAKCSGCGLCLEFCRKKALTLSPGRGVEALETELEVLREMPVE